MLNFSDLYTNVGSLLERSDTNIRTKIKVFLNDGLRYIVGFRPWMALLRNTTFSAVSGLDYFITGQEVDQIINISQRQTPIVLALAKYYALLTRNLDIITTTGYPVTATPGGDIGVKVALPSDGTIVVVSSSSSDTTQTVRIQGYSASTKLPIAETVTLNGTTNVTSANSYSSSEGYEPKFSKSADTTGIITITRSGTTISELAPTEREAKYRKWKVWPVFSTNLTMYLTFKKRVYQMSSDVDTPEIECDNAIVMFAFARCLQEKRQIAKAKEIYGVVDANGAYNVGSFMAELDALVAKEPQFGENFTDQLLPVVERDPIDTPNGQSGYMIYPSG